MENEKLLPRGEPTIPVQPTPSPSHFHLENKITSAPPVPLRVQNTHPSVRPVQEKIVSEPVPATPRPIVMSVIPPSGTLSGTPSPKAQQWGVVISIIVIVMMIVVGAFYAWGKRIAQQQAFIIQTTTP